MKVPDGTANYAIPWTRDSGQWIVVEPASVRTVNYADAVKAAP